MHRITALLCAAAVALTALVAAPASAKHRHAKRHAARRVVRAYRYAPPIALYGRRPYRARRYNGNFARAYNRDYRDYRDANRMVVRPAWSYPQSRNWNRSRRAWGRTADQSRWHARRAWGLRGGDWKRDKQAEKVERKAEKRAEKEERKAEKHGR